MTTVTVAMIWLSAPRGVEFWMSPREEQRTGELRFPGRSPGGYPAMLVLALLWCRVVSCRVISVVWVLWLRDLTVWGGSDKLERLPPGGL